MHDLNFQSEVAWSLLTSILLFFSSTWRIVGKSNWISFSIHFSCPMHESKDRGGREFEICIRIQENTLKYIEKYIYISHKFLAINRISFFQFKKIQINKAVLKESNSCCLFANSWLIIISGLYPAVSLISYPHWVICVCRSKSL